MRKLTALLSIFVFALTAVSAQTALDPNSTGNVVDITQFHNVRTLAVQQYDTDTSRLANLNFDTSRAGSKEYSLANGDAVVRYKQTFEGLPVYGADIVQVSTANNSFTTGSVAEIFDVNTTPTIDATTAQRLAARYIRSDKMTAELVLYPTKNETLLVWVIEENNFASDIHLFVDAHTGEIINAFNNMHTGTGVDVLGQTVEVESTQSGGTYRMSFSEGGASRTTYTANNGSSLPGTLMTDSNDNWNATSQRAAVSAHNYAGLTLDFFREKFALLLTTATTM